MLLLLQYGGFAQPGDSHVSIPQGHGDLCDVPSDLVFPLSVMKFKGVPVGAPGDVTGVLRYRYGDTFMVPRCGSKSQCGGGGTGQGRSGLAKAAAGAVEKGE